jgi:hypothetical protein
VFERHIHICTPPSLSLPAYILEKLASIVPSRGRAAFLPAERLWHGRCAIRRKASNSSNSQSVCQKGMPMARSSTPHSSTRRRSGHPPRQRHAQARAGGGEKTNAPNRWSHEVMQHSDALDLEAGIFKSGNAEEIAQSLKRSSLASRRRRGTPFQSAMSMLNFYLNRAGKNLSKERRRVLESAKGKLREAFGRPR